MTTIEAAARADAEARIDIRKDKSVSLRMDFYAQGWPGS